MSSDTREERELHAVTADGLVLCNPRARESAHPPENDDDAAAVARRQCLDLLY